MIITCPWVGIEIWWWEWGERLRTVGSPALSHCLGHWATGRTALCTLNWTEPQWSLILQVAGLIRIPWYSTLGQPIIHLLRMLLQLVKIEIINTVYQDLGWIRKQHLTLTSKTEPFNRCQRRPCLAMSQGGILFQSLQFIVISTMIRQVFSKVLFNLEIVENVRQTAITIYILNLSGKVIMSEVWYEVFNLNLRSIRKIWVDAEKLLWAMNDLRTKC